MIIATLANIHRDTQKQPEPFQPQDFFPGLADPQTSSAEVKALKLAKSLGWKGTRKKKHV